jgi:hypothetical protein
VIPLSILHVHPRGLTMIPVIILHIRLNKFILLYGTAVSYYMIWFWVFRDSNYPSGILPVFV